VCVHCRPSGSATPPQAVLDLMAALYEGDWEHAQTSSASHRSQASGLVAAHLQWHLERQLRTLPLVERPGYRVERMAGTGIRQDVAHGDQADGEEQLPTAASGA
jgi:DNA repair protein RecO (recombination protein O)